MSTILLSSPPYAATIEVSGIRLLLYGDLGCHAYYLSWHAVDSCDEEDGGEDDLRQELITMCFDLTLYKPGRECTYCFHGGRMPNGLRRTDAVRVPHPAFIYKLAKQ